ncbi:DUF2975 domain-containing protein [Arthrobacter sp. NPDC055585]
MEILPQRPVGPTLVVLTRTSLVLLFLTVVGAQILVIKGAQSMVNTYPEFGDIHFPLVAAGIVFGICVELVLVITGILVGYIRDGRIFGSSSLRLVDIMAAGLAAGSATVAFTLFLIPGPPALGLILVGGVLVGVTVTLVVLVLRSLLHRAAFMRAELDEVV